MIGLAAVGSLTELGDQRNLADERYFESVGQLFAATGSEQVVLLPGRRR